MSLIELKALSPLLVLAGAAVLVLVLAAFVRRTGIMTGLASAGLLAFLANIAVLWPSGPVVVAGQLKVDAFALLFWALLGLGTLAVLIFNQLSLRAEHEPGGEICGLFLLALTGGCILVSSVHFAGFFMGLELLSVSLFILISWQCRDTLSVEAGVKYLVLAGLASGFMLFGMALIYAAAGTLSFDALGQLATTPATEAWWLAGLALLLVGVVFKLSLAPFHFWTPDVYQGAPLPVTAFLSTVSKVAALGVLTRLVVSMELGLNTPLWQMLALLAAASILIGNWLALLQDDLKRLLACSSIAHMGYGLAGLLAGGALGVEAVIFYGFFYMVTTLAAFGALILAVADRPGSGLRIDDVTGLARRHPLPALVLTLALFSLAGVPLTGGFIGKFYVLTADAVGALWWLAGIVVAGSAIGLFYYLRVMLALFQDTEPGRGAVPAPLMSACLLALALAVLWLGILPGQGMELAETVARELVPGATLMAGAP